MKLAQDTNGFTFEFRKFPGAHDLFEFKNQSKPFLLIEYGETLQKQTKTICATCFGINRSSGLHTWGAADGKPLTPAELVNTEKDPPCALQTVDLDEMFGDETPSLLVYHDDPKEVERLCQSFWEPAIREFFCQILPTEPSMRHNPVKLHSTLPLKPVAFDPFEL